MFTYQANGKSFFKSTLFKVLLVVVLFVALSPGFLVNIPGRTEPLDADSNSLSVGDYTVASTPVENMGSESLWLQTVVHGLVFALLLLLLSGFLFN